MVAVGSVWRTGKKLGTVAALTCHPLWWVNCNNLIYCRAEVLNGTVLCDSLSLCPPLLNLEVCGTIERGGG